MALPRNLEVLARVRAACQAAAASGLGPRAPTKVGRRYLPLGPQPRSPGLCSQQGRAIRRRLDRTPLNTEIFYMQMSTPIRPRVLLSPCTLNTPSIHVGATVQVRDPGSRDGNHAPNTPRCPLEECAVSQIHCLSCKPQLQPEPQPPERSPPMTRTSCDGVCLASTHSGS